jgi:hypothetical protein
MQHFPVFVDVNPLECAVPEKPRGLAGRENSFLQPKRSDLLPKVFVMKPQIREAHLLAIEKQAFLARSHSTRNPDFIEKPQWK